MPNEPIWFQVCAFHIRHTSIKNDMLNATQPSLKEFYYLERRTRETNKSVISRDLVFGLRIIIS